MRKKIVYWKQKEEKLCDNLRLALLENRPYDVSRLIRQLEKKLRWMIESIMVKYFTYNYNDTEIYINDTFSHLILAIPKFSPSKNKTYYSYLSATTKNELNNQIVGGYVYGYKCFSRNDHKIPFERDEKITENIDQLFPITDDDGTNDEHNRQKLYTLCEKLIEEYRQKEANATLQTDVTHYMGLRRAVEGIYETARTFEGNKRISKSEMVDYAVENYGISPYYMNKAFNTKGFLRKNTLYLEKRKENYINAYVDYDFLPNHNYAVNNYRKKKIMEIYGDFYKKLEKKK